MMDPTRKEDTLNKGFRGEYVARNHEHGIIASAESWLVLKDKLEELGIEPNTVVREFEPDLRGVESCYW